MHILRSLEHPNVIRLYEFFEDDPKTYFLSMEYMRGGEVFDDIVRKVGLGSEFVVYGGVMVVYRGSG